eukprot:4427078-Pyramimonas_sp.AAC.1
MFASVNPQTVNCAIHAVQSMWCNLGGTLHVVQSVWRKALQIISKQCTAVHNATQRKAMRRHATQCNAVHSSAAQCKAVRSNAAQGE